MTTADPNGDFFIELDRCIDGLAMGGLAGGASIMISG